MPALITVASPHGLEVPSSVAVCISAVSERSSVAIIVRVEGDVTHVHAAAMTITHIHFIPLRAAHCVQPDRANINHIKPGLR